MKVRQETHTFTATLPLTPQRLEAICEGGPEIQRDLDAAAAAFLAREQVEARVLGVELRKASTSPREGTIEITARVTCAAEQRDLP